MAIMKDTSPKYGDEINLFDFFKTLWDGKLTITVCAVITVLVGAGYIFVKDSIYESRLTYSIDTIPPFYEKQKIIQDFQNLFYSKSLFEDWKRSTGNISLSFEELSETIVIDGIVVSKNEEDKLVIFVKNKDSSFILVKSNELFILDEFFKYANYINRVLMNRYIILVSDALKITKARFNELNYVNQVVEIGLSIDRFVMSAQNGANLLKIQHATIPIKTSPISSLIIILSFILGIIIGFCVVFIQNGKRMYREKLVKT